MKRLLMLVAATVAVAGLASIALAGDYHIGQLLVCSDCHVLHGSQAHAYPETGKLDVPGSLSMSAGPYDYLLRQDDINTTCLMCHDGRSDVPDVLGATSAGPTNGRLAGGLNVATGAPNTHFVNDAGYAPGDGHSLWSTDLPPGFDATIAGGAYDGYTKSTPLAEGLNCADCHSVHGSANYRNLLKISYKASPFTKNVTYSIGTIDLTKDVYEAAARGYGWDNVQYVERDANTSAYADWCKTCHSKFHGLPGDASTIGGSATDATVPMHRHPTAGVDIGTSILAQINAHTHKVKLMSNSPAASPWDYTNTAMTPSCFTCHKSHGNRNGFGLIWFVDNTTTGPNAPATVGPITEEGDNYGGATYRDLCRQCHPMGSFSSGNPRNIIP